MLNCILNTNKDCFPQFDSQKLAVLDYGDSLLIPIKINHQPPLISGFNKSNDIEIGGTSHRFHKRT